MKRTFFIVVAASALASPAFAGVAGAQSGDPSTSVRAVPVQYYERGEAGFTSLREHEARISEWIDRGLNEGRLRPWQARRLQRELGDIQARERAMEADGSLSGREFAELNRDLDNLAANVRDQMRFEERRY